MQADQARKAWARARDEKAIMGDSIERAYQVIGDLLCSDGDHSEDVETLRGLIEGWVMLEAAHGEEMASIEQQAKAQEEVA